ncbi:hypothetical protein PJJ84_14490 [Mycobacterium kansasii]|jgi:hypothetical protein|uniref:hypothetical protein n=1 Tax=Mycobacterium simiae TaxID=1784 RepID=UPI002620CC16|nr:hypothetical protein [Mycobacterium simiae]
MNTTPAAPTTIAGRAAECLGYQLATRPRLRRAATVWFTLHWLASWSVAAAPPAAASTIGGALNWTGITDSYGVPVGNYYLSVVSTSEAITKAGPGLSADPSSWARWLANALNTGLTHEAVAELLSAQAAAYIFMITLALWLMRFAMSNTWLYWLTTWLRPIFETLRTILADLWVFPICLTLGLGVGAYHLLWHGRKGFGAGIMLSTTAVGILGMMLTGDPLSDLYRENGLLTQGRNLGFTVAQAGLNNGAITPGGGGAQLQHLTGLIADATVRMPLQLMNFGEPIDNIGGCGQAYTAAMLTPHDPGDLAGPAHAMTRCGAPQALSFAQHLDGSNLALGLFYSLLGAIFALFICYVTYSYVMACCAALLNALLSVVAAGPAMIHGAPRRRAARRLTLFFKHAALLFAYTLYISVTALIVLKMAARGGYADQVGMTHPLARLIMIALFSAAAIGAFRWLKHQLGDHTRHELTHAVTELARHGRDGYQRGRDTYDRGRDLNARAPWNKPANTHAGDKPDTPHTGDPAAGRPPGGRPPTPGRGRRPHPPTPPSGPTPAAASAATTTAAPSATAAARAASAGAKTGRVAATAATAGEAAATVAAPEVIAGAAVAAHVAQKLHSPHNNKPGHGQPRPATARATPPKPTFQPPPAPANGRHPGSIPPPAAAPDTATPGAPSPEQTPVKGR